MFQGLLRRPGHCHFYNFFTPCHAFSSLFLHAEIYAFNIVKSRSWVMDIAYIGGIAALWGLLALMVWGFKKLEKPEGGRA